MAHRGFACEIYLMNETVDVLVLIEQGKDPVFITRPAVLTGKDLNDFLVARGILHKQAGSGEMKEPIGSFLQNAATKVDAFYFSESGPFLMLFDMETKIKGKSGNEVGVVAGLIGDSDLDQLFAVTGASARVLCCTKGSFEALRRYAAELSAKQTDV